MSDGLTDNISVSFDSIRKETEMVSPVLDSAKLKN